MNILLQICNMKDGSRSEPMQSDTTEFAGTLRKWLEEQEHKEYMVLVLMDQTRSEDWDFSIAPFMSAQSYIDYFSNGEAVQNG